MSVLVPIDKSPSKIEELQFSEIEQVDGAVAPLIAIAYVGIGLSGGTLALGGGFLVGLRLSQH